MSTPRSLYTSPNKARKVKEVVGSKCELCGKAGHIDDLEVHTLIDDEDRTCHPADLEARILVLCSRCHADLHALPTSIGEQELLVRQRQPDIRARIRFILGYVPKPYNPPDSDVEGAYKDACASRFGNLI